jgi:hypothetical protein
MDGDRAMQTGRRFRKQICAAQLYVTACLLVVAHELCLERPMRVKEPCLAILILR